MTHLKWRVATVALLAPCMVAAGCMGPTINRPDALRAYDDAKPCCLSFATAKSEPLQFGVVQSSQIDQRNQAFDFGRDGVSFFELFEVPITDKSFSCKIVSHAAGDGHALNVFFPKVALITDRFSILRDEANEGSGGSDPIGSKQGGVYIDIAATPDQHVRYLAIHTTRDYVANGRDIQLSPREIGLGVGVAVMKESGEVHFLGSPISAAGNMDISCSVGI